MSESRELLDRNTSAVSFDDLARFSDDVQRAVGAVAEVATLLGHHPESLALLEILAAENRTQLSTGGAELIALTELRESLRARRSPCMLLLFGLSHNVRVKSGECEPLRPEYGSQHERALSLLDRFVLPVTGHDDLEAIAAEMPGLLLLTLARELTGNESDALVTELKREEVEAAKFLRQSGQQSIPKEVPRLTEDEQRDEFCLGLQLQGKSYRQINQAIKKHPSFEGFEHDRSVRGPIRRAAERRGIEISKRKPGRPSKKRRNPK